jgi:predicted CopG family antitoxin
MRTAVYMARTEYRNVRLTEAAYRQLERRKLPGESFSDTVERLAGERSLLELAGMLADDEAQTMREAIEEGDRRSRDRLNEHVERLDP